MTEATMDTIVCELLEFAIAGQFVSELNGYEADEHDIPNSSYTVCHLAMEGSDRPAAVRIEENGNVVAWATVNDKNTVLATSNPDMLIQCHELL
jgi:hypothetical protein